MEQTLESKNEVYKTRVQFNFSKMICQFSKLKEPQN